MTPRTLALVAIAFVSLVSCAQFTPVPEQERFFTQQVKPILQRNCLRCHNGVLLPQALNLSSSATAFAARADGKRYLVPGKPSQSYLLTAVSRRGGHPKMMPRLDTSLTDDDIGVLTEWVQDGATWPQGKAGQLKHEPSAEQP